MLVRSDFQLVTDDHTILIKARFFMRMGSNFCFLTNQRWFPWYCGRFLLFLLANQPALNLLIAAIGMLMPAAFLQFTDYSVLFCAAVSSMLMAGTFLLTTNHTAIFVIALRFMGMASFFREPTSQFGHNRMAAIGMLMANAFFLTAN